MRHLVSRQRRQPDDLASVVQTVDTDCGKECAEAPKRAEVCHLVFVPQEWVKRREPSNGVGSRIHIREPDDLTFVVDEESPGVRATQCTQILLVAVLPEKRASLSSLRRTYKLVKQGERIGDRVRSFPDYLAQVVDGARQTILPSKRCEILNLSILPKNSTELL